MVSGVAIVIGIGKSELSSSQSCIQAAAVPHSRKTSKGTFTVWPQGNTHVQKGSDIKKNIVAGKLYELDLDNKRKKKHLDAALLLPVKKYIVFF